MIRVSIMDIQASMREQEPVIVGPALVTGHNIASVRPIVSMTQEDGTNDQFIISGSLLTFLNGTERVMYVGESVDEMEALIDADYRNSFVSLEGVTEAVDA